MSSESEDELDSILAGYVEPVQACDPAPTPEILGTVQSPTLDAVGAEGMAPHEGSGGEMRTGGDLCQGPPPSLPHAHHITILVLPLMKTV